MLKKIFRSAYEDVKDTNGRYLRQTVNEIRLVDVPDMEVRWEVIADMSKQNFHQVLPVHDIQAGFIRSAIKYGAELTDIVLREVEKPERVQVGVQEAKPVKSLLSRFLGVGESAEEVLESRERLFQEKMDKHLEYVKLQEEVRNQLDAFNKEPKDLDGFYENLGNHYVDIVKVKMDNQVFTLESNGFFYYQADKDTARKMETILLNECQHYFE